MFEDIKEFYKTKLKERDTIRLKKEFLKKIKDIKTNRIDIAIVKTELKVEKQVAHDVFKELVDDGFCDGYGKILSNQNESYKGNKKDCPLCGESNRLYIQMKAIIHLSVDDSLNPIFPESINFGDSWETSIRQQQFRLVCGGCCRSTDDSEILKKLFEEVYHYGRPEMRFEQD